MHRLTCAGTWRGRFAIADGDSRTKCSANSAEHPLQQHEGIWVYDTTTNNITTTDKRSLRRTCGRQAHVRKHLKRSSKKTGSAKRKTPLLGRQGHRTSTGHSLEHPLQQHEGIWVYDTTTNNITTTDKRSLRRTRGRQTHVRKHLKRSQFSKKTGSAKRKTPLLGRQGHRTSTGHSAT